MTGRPKSLVVQISQSTDKSETMVRLAMSVSIDSQFFDRGGNLCDQLEMSFVNAR